MICPLCSYENIDGVDTCEKCESSLYGLSNPQPHSSEERHILKDRIYLLAPRRAIMVSADASVGEVLQTLVKHGVGCVLIMKDDDLVGIFTERDALMRLNVEADQQTHRPIREFMTPNPQTLEITDKIAFALHKMDVGGYRHIPVLAEGRLTGVISLRDILKYFSDHLLAAPV